MNKNSLSAKKVNSLEVAGVACGGGHSVGLRYGSFLLPNKLTWEFSLSKWQWFRYKMGRGLLQNLVVKMQP